jgi:hypothetical protein
MPACLLACGSLVAWHAAWIALTCTDAWRHGQSAPLSVHACMHACRSLIAWHAAVDRVDMRGRSAAWAVYAAVRACLHTARWPERGPRGSRLHARSAVCGHASPVEWRFPRQRPSMPHSRWRLASPAPGRVDAPVARGRAASQHRARWSQACAPGLAFACSPLNVVAGHRRPRACCMPFAGRFRFPVGVPRLERATRVGRAAAAPPPAAPRALALAGLRPLETTPCWRHRPTAGRRLVTMTADVNEMLPSRCLYFRRCSRAGEAIVAPEAAPQTSMF